MNGWRVWPAGVLLACVLAARGQVGPPVEDAVRDAIPPDRTPVILVPGVSREVGAQLRGGRLVPFSALALRTDAEALANLGDPRFPAGGSRPLAIPARLDRCCAAWKSGDCKDSSTGWFATKATSGAIPSSPWTRTTPRIPRPSERSDSPGVSLRHLLRLAARHRGERLPLANRVARIRARTGASRVLPGRPQPRRRGGPLLRAPRRPGCHAGSRLLPGERGPRGRDQRPPASAIGAMVTLGAPHQGSALAPWRADAGRQHLGSFECGLARTRSLACRWPWQLLPFARCRWPRSSPGRIQRDRAHPALRARGCGSHVAGCPATRGIPR
ncbi:MAG: hypothetical protein MZV49_15695 [Rhodopseudomonas palustris]|nr:hypothetical protein [Rhodopseudomonas palustris]